MVCNRMCSSGVNIFDDILQQLYNNYSLTAAMLITQATGSIIGHNQLNCLVIPSVVTIISRPSPCHHLPKHKVFKFKVKDVQFKRVGKIEKNCLSRMNGGRCTYFRDCFNKLLTKGTHFWANEGLELKHCILSSPALIAISIVVDHASLTSLRDIFCH